MTGKKKFVFVAVITLILVIPTKQARNHADFVQSNASNHTANVQKLQEIPVATDFTQAFTEGHLYKVISEEEGSFRIFNEQQKVSEFGKEFTNFFEFVESTMR